MFSVAKAVPFMRNPQQTGIDGHFYNGGPGMPGKMQVCGGRRFHLCVSMMDFSEFRHSGSGSMEIPK